MTQYSVTLPHGEKLFRSSKRVYTHAVAVWRPTNGDGSGAWFWTADFCGSASLAEKRVQYLHRIWVNVPGVRITVVPVEK